jgi:hypothetical protein
MVKQIHVMILHMGSGSGNTYRKNNLGYGSENTYRKNNMGSGSGERQYPD